jgi:hypothetical protein
MRDEVNERHRQLRSKRLGTSPSDAAWACHQPGKSRTHNYAVFVPDPDGNNMEAVFRGG